MQTSAEPLPLFDFPQPHTDAITITPLMTSPDGSLSLQTMDNFSNQLQPSATLPIPTIQLEQGLLEFNNTFTNYVTEQSVKPYEAFQYIDSGITSHSECSSSLYSENTMPQNFAGGFFDQNCEYAESDASSYDTNPDFSVLANNAQCTIPRETYVQTFSSEDATTASQKMKPKRKRVINKTQRKAANVRERTRMNTLNDAFDHLKEKIPKPNSDRKLSRIETLTMAMGYINYMKDLISGVPVGALELTGTQKKQRTRRSNRK